MRQWMTVQVGDCVHTVPVISPAKGESPAERDERRRLAEERRARVEAARVAVAAVLDALPDGESEEVLDYFRDDCREY